MSTEWKWTGDGAEFYERELVPTIMAFWAPKLIGAALPSEGDRILDLACGTGVVAREASQHVGETGTVVGMDMNGGMLAKARTVASDLGRQVEWREASAEAIPFEDENFSIAYCQLGLQFFDDKAGCLDEIYRVLQPSGRLAVLVWRAMEFTPGFQALNDALEKHIGDEAGAYMHSPFALSDGAELRSLMESAGFQDVAVRAEVGPVRFSLTEEFVRIYVAATPLADMVLNAGEDARKQLVEDVKAAMAAHESQDGLSFPIEAHLATARK